MPFLKKSAFCDNSLISTVFFITCTSSAFIPYLIYKFLILSPTHTYFEKRGFKKFSNAGVSYSPCIVVTHGFLVT
mgnify:CR=1 FL=1